MKNNNNLIIKKLTDYVSKKPIILFDIELDDSLAIIGSRNGINQFTMVKHHDEFDVITGQSLCLADIKNAKDTHEIYLGIISNKSAVSTLDTRISIRKMFPVNLGSFNELSEQISDKRMQTLFEQRIPETGTISVLTPKLSGEIITVLAGNRDNTVFLSIINNLPISSNYNLITWAQDDAIRLALKTFGLAKDENPESVFANSEDDSRLSYIYEDTVIMYDANNIPGFERIKSDYTGKAVFKTSEEQLTVYTANRLPLEEVFGVDLIYINDTKESIVMVQYKMLEEEGGREQDWIFRPDSQFDSEIKKMHIPKHTLKISDYRMCGDPFFFKFIRRKGIDVNKSIHLSLEHLKQHLASPQCQGSRGGIRISYKALCGQYLREGDLVKLIQSGYIGTHKEESELLIPIIEEISKGNKKLIIAWQQRLFEEDGERR